MKVTGGILNALINLSEAGMLPKPVTRWRDKDSGEVRMVKDARPIELFAKIVEETAEAMRDLAKMEARIAMGDGATAERYRQATGMELTDIITACTTLLSTLGFDLTDTAVLQRMVNEKNRKRGYHEEA